jgi:hypothetical protein
VRGRKPTQESRSAEFRQRLIAWKQSPESSRPSLRALARELTTSHQLLGHYLAGLEKWHYRESCRKATQESDQILAGAYLDDRPLTEWEKQRVHHCTMASLRAQAASDFLNKIEQIKRDAKRGPLHPEQIKMLQLFARAGFPEALKLLQQCSPSGTKRCDGNLPAISAGAAKSCRTVPG